MRTEAPDYLRETFEDDDFVRAWVAQADRPMIAALPKDEKLRMLKILVAVAGRTSDEDVAAFEWICRAVETPTELAYLRDELQWTVAAVSNEDRYARIHAALGRTSW